MARKAKQKQEQEQPSSEVIIKRVIGVGRVLGMNLTPQLVQLANDDKGIDMVRRITHLCVKSNPTMDDIDEFAKSWNNDQHQESEGEGHPDVEQEPPSPETPEFDKA